MHEIVVLYCVCACFCFCCDGDRESYDPFNGEECSTHNITERARRNHHTTMKLGGTINPFPLCVVVRESLSLYYLHSPPG